MKYLSLFSGIGGFELGIQQACRKNKFVCIGYSEIDKYAIKIYQTHFPQHTNFGDIRKINTEEIPDFDFLVGGFPCQSFSIAGKRLGFNDTRGTLFFEIARILRDKRPKRFLLENVKGLLSHDNGRTFKIIIASLVQLGYSVEWQVLNSKNFGVPQNRERVFIVGHLGKTRQQKIFPFTESNGEDIILPTITTRVTANTNGTYVGKRSPRQILEESQSDRVYDPKGISLTLTSSNGKTGLYAVKKIPEIKIRRLTPIECERLQGFSDNWTEGISDSQRYKCLGNAVTVNVIEGIVRKINFSKCTR